MKAVGAAVVKEGKTVVGAAAGELMLLADGATLEPGYCAAAVVERREPVFIGSFSEWHEEYWASASFAADSGFASLAALPLMAAGVPVGVLLFHFSVPVNFDDEFRQLLISVAQHCAQALDRARLYEDAQTARAEAEEANRLKDEFVSIVSHELRTPLNAMLGWASMLQAQSLDAETVPRALEAIHNNATRQAKLVDDLLDFSRMMSGRAKLELEKIEAPAVILGIVESMIPLAAAKQIELKQGVVPAVTLTGDVRRLEQVFVNLLSNAVKFTPPGGRIAIDGRLVDQMLEIRVSDTGAGIDPEFLPFVFDRFRQGDSTATRTHGGLGLGLAIARQLIEAHNGRIEVASDGPNRGAVFTVTLPISGDLHDRRSSVRHAPRESEDQPPTLAGLKVLVVDDEPDALEVVSQALVTCGASVTVASRAADAFRVLEREHIDVLLTDIAMPGEDGYSLVRRLRSSTGKSAGIPAVAITAHARENDRDKALAAGFQIHVTKPIDPFDLARRIHDLVAHV